MLAVLPCGPGDKVNGRFETKLNVRWRTAIPRPCPSHEIRRSRYPGSALPPSSCALLDVWPNVGPRSVGERLENLMARYLDQRLKLRHLQGHPRHQPARQPAQGLPGAAADPARPHPQPAGDRGDRRRAAVRPARQGVRETAFGTVLSQSAGVILGELSRLDATLDRLVHDTSVSVSLGAARRRRRRDAGGDQAAERGASGAADQPDPGPDRGADPQPRGRADRPDRGPSL